MLTIETIDIEKLGNVSGGVRPGPNGEGCTPTFPRPRPNPNPGPLGGGTGGIGGPGGLGGIDGGIQ